MTVRREIAEPRRETGAWSPEDLRRTRAVRRRPEGRARRPKACRNSGSAIAAEVLMNHAGETRLDREGMSVRGGGGELQEGGGWKLMIFRARATRGRGLPSLDARSRRSISPHPCRHDKRAWTDIYIVRRAQWKIHRPLSLKRERASLEGAKRAD